jgi:SAM-dependent methyltransferase
MIPGREPLQGARQILRFNWPFYGAAVLLSAVLCATPLRPAALPALFWICSSLITAVYVYDLSPLYTFAWLHLPNPPRFWIHLHAGFDETSHLLEQLFPATRHRIFNLYDPAEMTEHSIARARAAGSPRTDWRALPLATNCCDAVFLLFAAHEFRSASARTALFAEIARVLRGGGKLVIAEHARDWRNFLAFGPGFLHFLPESAWYQAAAAAGLVVRSRRSVTPFVSVFILERST